MPKYIFIVSVLAGVVMAGCMIGDSEGSQDGAPLDTVQADATGDSVADARPDSQSDAAADSHADAGSDVATDGGPYDAGNDVIIADAIIADTGTPDVPSTGCVYETWHVRYTLPAGMQSHSIYIEQYGDYSTSCPVGQRQDHCENGDATAFVTSAECDVRIGVGQLHRFQVDVLIPGQPPPQDVAYACHSGVDNTGFDLPATPPPYRTLGTVELTAPDGTRTSWSAVDNGRSGCNIKPDGWR